MPHKKKCEKCQKIFQPKRKTARFCLECRKLRRNNSKARKPAETSSLPRFHFRKLRCPDCRSTKLKGYGTQKPGTTIERYHRCKDCGLGFRTWENAE